MCAGNRDSVAECDAKCALEVSQEAIGEASKCCFDFACVNRGPAPCCEVKQWLSKKYAFVKNTRHHQCPYSIPFGIGSRVCACPVRNEIYRKYGK